jgi:hypothetical protein
MITIDWNHLFLVAATSVLAAVSVIILFSVGIRLLTNAEHAKKSHKGSDMKALRSEALNRAVAYVMFGLSFGTVIFGVLLVIPGVIKGV